MSSSTGENSNSLKNVPDFLLGRAEDAQRSSEAESTAGEGSTFRGSIPLGTAHLPEPKGSEPAAEANADRELQNPFVSESLPSLEGPKQIRPAAAGAPKSKLKILLADEDADMRSYLARLLSARYSVETVSNFVDALQAVIDAPPALMISDVMMLQPDRFAWIAELRRNPRTRSVPVILLSTRAGEQASVEGLKAGADDYLVKPFSAGELMARVGSNLELAELRAERARADELSRTVAVIERQWRLFDATLSHTQDFNYLFDLEGRFTYVNRALLDLWQKTLSEAVGKDFFELGYPPPLARRLQDQIQQVIATREPVRDETPFTAPSGETRHYEYIFVPVSAPDGRVEAVAGSTRDVTGFKQAEQRERDRQEQLRETARLESLGVMAGGIAHDFNNLLTGILGNASLLSEVSSGQARDFAAQIVLSAERAADLVQQILAYSGKGRFVIETFDLNRFVSENLTILKASISRSISVRLDLHPYPLFIDADRAQVQQIVMNLLINASDAIAPVPGEIRMSTRLTHIREPRPSLLFQSALQPGPHAVFEVSDTGAGMTPETLRRIFDPFFTTKFTGRGLGLAAVLGIVRSHAGDIEVSSEVGRGATFRVLLPARSSQLFGSDRESAPVAPQPYSAEPAIAALRSKVLVVDDEAIVRDTAKAALESYGYPVVLAEDGQAAIRMLASDPAIAVLILDLTMPVMTGEQAIPLIRQLRPLVKIILSSGFGQSELSTRFASAGLHGFLQKPYTAAVLRESVERALKIDGEA